MKEFVAEAEATRLVRASRCVLEQIERGGSLVTLPSVFYNLHGEIRAFLIVALVDRFYGNLPIVNLLRDIHFHVFAAITMPHHTRFPADVHEWRNALRVAARTMLRRSWCEL